MLDDTRIERSRGVRGGHLGAPHWPSISAKAELVSGSILCGSSAALACSNRCSTPGRTADPVRWPGRCPRLRLRRSTKNTHWPQDRRDTTLGVLLIRMAAETAEHAGHADIIRELIDGKAGANHDEVLDEPSWRDYLAQIQAAADSFRTQGTTPTTEHHLPAG
ncbi:MAG: DUF664 domain-containing protein [Trebonia sp.]